MKLVLRENWYTQKPKKWGFAGTLFITSLVYALSRWHFMGHDLSASGFEVFHQHQYWRAWSSLFVHADLAHLLANTPLLVLFTYLLISRFNILVPLFAFFIGGFLNLIVLKTMPLEGHLLGASGVVHAVGALWLSLHVFIDQREKLKTRFGSALFLVLMLFIPDTYRPQVSYLSHFLGFMSGVVIAYGISRIWRATFLSVERWDEVPEPVIEFDWNPSVNSSESSPESAIFP
ncbi:MAG: rhomboid family intramembrane serine protease [Bacteriovoracaceae bacterium]|nr:rhomboid family intramembrane serine protease [Bacteriovoracaceae bacterium]